MTLDARFQPILHTLPWAEALRRAESGCCSTITQMPAGYVTVYDNGYTVTYGLDCQPVLVECQGYTWTPPPPGKAET